MKSGDKVVLYVGIEGSIHKLDGGWLFIPRGGRVLDGWYIELSQVRPG